MTLEQIRAALPTHIMLTPGVKLKPGDEIWKHTSPVTGVWAAVFVAGGVNSRPFRRPIPPHILDNQAFWLYVENTDAAGLTKQDFEAWGGYDNYLKLKAGGRLYDKWLLEQITEVKQND